MNGQVVSFKDLGRQLSRDEQLAALEAWQPDPELVKRGDWEDALEAQRPAGTSDAEWFDFTDHAARCYSIDEPLKITSDAGGLIGVGLGVHGEKALQLRKAAGQAAEVWVPLNPAPANDDWLAIPNDSPFRVIESGEFAGGAYVEPDWLIEELIPARGIGLAWGLSGSDKTGVVFDLMAATHRGVAWRDKAVKRGRSVMVVAEGEYFFANRLRAYAKDRNIDVSELPAVVPCAINLRDNKQVTAFALELKKLGAAQVWFDTLQQCSPGADENSVRDMGEVITNLKFLSRTVGCFAGVVHHAGKQIEKGARGSSAWRPAVDAELYFESDGTHGTMRVEKLKDAAPYSVYPFERRIVELGTRPNGKPITSVVVVQSDQAPFAKTKLPTPQTDARKAYDIAVTGITNGHGEAEESDVIAQIAGTKKEPEAGEKDRRKSRATVEVNRLVLQGYLIRAGRTLRTTNVVQGEPGENF